MAEQKIQLEIITPGKLLLSESADMVVIPGGEGDFGVLPGHAPLLAGVRPGTIQVYQGDKVVKSIFVEGGIAEVSGEQCTVLAEEALAVADLDAAAAEASLKAARDAQGADKEHVDGKDSAEVLVAEARMAALAVL
ncbi:MAG TPA: ATP synthase F1 subunit epsilon [Rhodospirillales bacterium]|nr:ATP synthase F1 subunit epsilon [Rhodospirillales bacterium]